MRPRLIAKEIEALPTRAERNAALQKVPEQFRELVRAHVEDYFARKKFAPKERSCK